METSLFKLALALGIGLLMGLQRQRVDSRLAGIRTFPLIALFGALMALSAPAFGPWLVAAGLIALALLLLIANLIKLRTQTDPGMTTEVAVLLCYGLGAYLVIGHTEAAVAVAGTAVLLLYMKDPLHRAIGAMSERDVMAVMQFALVTLVVLPVLPDRTYGPYDVLNPFRIWLMVVLIVTINLAGFVAHKLSAGQTGALLAGVVGGLVSSTATTVSYARRSRSEASDPAAAALAALVIVVASAVSLLRVTLMVGVLASGLFLDIAWPLCALLGGLVLLSALAWWRGRRREAGTMPEAGNPAELKPALVFGALYAVVILAVAFVKERFGDAALYPVALLSGLTDVDAITLSTLNLAQAGRLEAEVTSRLILLAVLANIAFKGGCALLLGSPALRPRIALYFGLALAGGAALLPLGR
ncbi:MgtC/SapB family protein [Azohydromonas sp. G-1-1-14]|uniref:MgtC/SapB family protein n=1 Tax=Azohydromonas caseinilytica TaxID=2728836 RepID=A0A848FES6_9BURK|nr:MgtC/SapB family protein [Azohydromonas caseinilytica]